MQRKLYSHPDQRHTQSSKNTQSSRFERQAPVKREPPRKPARPNPPRVMSRDELAVMDMPQLRAGIGALEAAADGVRALGHDAREWEVESCYMRRELESRMPPRREQRHEGS